AQLVVQLRPGRRVAVRRIEAANQHALHGSLDVTAVAILRICGQSPAGLDRIGIAGEDGDTVPAPLAVPYGAVTGPLDQALGEFFLRRLQFLQANRIRPGLLQPSQENVDPAVDAIDVESRDLHPRRPASCLP